MFVIIQFWRRRWNSGPHKNWLTAGRSVFLFKHVIHSQNIWMRTSSSVTESLARSVHHSGIIGNTRPNQRFSTYPTERRPNLPYKLTKNCPKPSHLALLSSFNYSARNPQSFAWRDDNELNNKHTH